MPISQVQRQTRLLADCTNQLRYGDSQRHLSSSVVPTSECQPTVKKKTAGFNSPDINMVIGNVPRQREGEYFQACPYSQEEATIACVVEEM